MKLNPLKVIAFVSLPILLVSFQNCSKVGTNGIAVDQLQSAESTQLLPPVAGAGAVDPAGSVPPKNSDPGSVTPSSNGQTSSQTSSQTTNPTPNQPSSRTSNQTTSQTSNQTANQTNNQTSHQNCHTSTTKDHEQHIAAGNKKDNDDEDDDDDRDDDHSKKMSDKYIVEVIKACNDPKALSQPSENLILQFNHENIELDANNVSSINGNNGKFILVRAAKENATVDSIHVNHTTLILCNFADVKAIKGTYNKIIVVGGKVHEAQENHSEILLVNASMEKNKGSQTIVKSYQVQ